jgi:hypothetical protein
VIWYLGRWFLRDSLPRLGSMLFPWALRMSLRLAMGPRLVRWSAEGEVMMESQMTAWLVALDDEEEDEEETTGHSAVT